MFIWRYVAFSEYFFLTISAFFFVWRVRHPFFPSGWCSFYLVTTGWIFDISLLCENSFNQICHILGGNFARRNVSWKHVLIITVVSNNNVCVCVLVCMYVWTADMMCDLCAMLVVVFTLKTVLISIQYLRFPTLCTGSFGGRSVHVILLSRVHSRGKKGFCCDFASVCRGLICTYHILLFSSIRSTQQQKKRLWLRNCVSLPGGASGEAPSPAPVAPTVRHSHQFLSYSSVSFNSFST